MRQRRRDGTGFVRVSTAAEPASATLRRLCGFFSASLLAELNEALMALTSTADEAKVKAVVAGLQSSAELRATYGPDFFELEDDQSAEPARRELSSTRSRSRTWPTAKLSLLLLKRRRKEPALTAEVLWERVWRRTDDVFVATEDLKPIFEAAVRELAKELGIGSRTTSLVRSRTRPDLREGAGRLCRRL